MTWKQSLVSQGQNSAWQVGVAHLKGLDLPYQSLYNGHLFPDEKEGPLPRPCQARSRNSISVTQPSPEHSTSPLSVATVSHAEHPVTHKCAVLFHFSFVQNRREMLFIKPSQCRNILTLLCIKIAKGLKPNLRQKKKKMTAMTSGYNTKVFMEPGDYFYTNHGNYEQ